MINFMDQMTADIAAMVANILQSTVAEALARVNGDNSGVEGDSSTAMGRIRDYATTPGTKKKSHAQWLVAARNALIDDLQAVRRSPDDVTARLRLAISIAIYSAAGDSFADIVVSAGSKTADDPLARPALTQTSVSRAVAVRAEHLSSGIKLAVFNVTSDDPVTVQEGRTKLKRIMLDGDDHDAQIAAALLGIVGDPMNHNKLIRLKDELVDEYVYTKRAAEKAETITAGDSSAPITSAADVGSTKFAWSADTSNSSTGEK
ncbi:MAG: hypothetical protein OSB00_10915 [Sphingomonas bacterium]|nr:hypothetical protein [Sphingomonas bacterium]